MNKHRNNNHRDLGILDSLTTKPAAEFAAWSSELETEPVAAPSPFAKDQDYRFCRAVADQPLQPCSIYPKNAGVSPKDAVAIRQRLMEVGYLRSRQLDTGRRGRSSLLLEVTGRGLQALESHERKEF